jgi:predicted nucleic-acid-binding protein
MIGLDTNVVVRYLVQDDPIQSARAADLIEHQLTEQNPGFLCVVVVAEIAWVLERAYRFPATEITAAIERLLQADVLVVEHEQHVFTAIAALRTDLGSFADALIDALNIQAGCSCTATFDQRALRLPGFVPL